MTAAPTSPSAHPASALPPGTRLGEFEVLSVLGIGGFGIVYLALDHALEREVAIKEYMPASLAGRTETMHVSLRSQSDAETFALGRRSFVNEARLLARFDHPSLLKVYRFWEANDTAYMSMPVYRGRTLKAVRDTLDGPPDEAWVRALLLPLLGAIETLHAQEVFHRDIAPDNILLEPDGRPVLLDFGAARRVIGDRSQALTAILKPAYAPIEQYAESTSVRQGPWTDLYALGATLYYVLTGRAPAPSTARTLHDDVAPLATLDLPGCGPGLLQAIDWMLAPRPGDRPQSVAELRAVLAGGVVPPPAATAVERTRVQTPRPGAPTPGVSATASAATVFDASIGAAASRERAQPATDLPLELDPAPQAAAPAGVAGSAARHGKPEDAASAAPAGAAVSDAGPAAAAPGRGRGARAAVPVVAGLLVAGAGALWWAWPGATVPVSAPTAASVAASAAAAADAAAEAVASEPPPAARVATPRPAPAAPPATATTRPAAAPPATAVARPAASPPPVPRPAATVAPPVVAVPATTTRADPPAAAAGPTPSVPAPPVVQAPPAPLSDAPEAICGKRVLLAQVLCMERECRTDAYENHPACRKWWQQNRPVGP